MGSEPVSHTHIHYVRFIFAASSQQYFSYTQNQHQPVSGTFLSQKISTSQPNTLIDMKLEWYDLGY